MKRFAHKTFLLSTTLVLILLMLPVSALADEDGGGNEFIQTANGYRVVLVFEKPASVGDNQIHIQVNDVQNMPVSNADVEVSVVENETEQPGSEVHTSTDGQMADMPGMVHDPQPPSTKQDEMAADMPGMDMSGTAVEAPAISREKTVMTTLEAGHESGEYAGKIAIEVPGNYILHVYLTVQGQRTKVDFPLNIVQTQNVSSILLGFFTVNVAIIAVAVLLKPKPLSVPLSKRA